VCTVLSDKIFGGKVGKETIQPVLTALLTEVKKSNYILCGKIQNQIYNLQMLLLTRWQSLPELAVYFAQNLSLNPLLTNPWKCLMSKGVSLNK